MADDQNLEGVDEGVDERPEWLPENFKSPDDLVKSYKDGQTKIRELSDRARAQEAQIQQILAAQEAAAAQQQQRQYDPSAEERWQDEFDRDPFRTTSYLAQQQAEAVFERRFAEWQQRQQQQFEPIGSTQQELVANYAKGQLATRYDDWAEYEPKVLEAIANGDIVVPDDVLSSVDKTSKILDTAYRMIKADDLLANARKAGEQQAQTARERKLGAQTMPGSSTARTAASEDDYHALAKAVHQGGSPYGSL